MRRAGRLLCWTAILLIAAGLGTAAHATSLLRAGLEELVAQNRTIVLGEVVDTVSYWNDEGTFILTDVHIRTDEVLKGNTEGSMLTVTLMGGTVDDVTTLIVGGAELIPGGSYVLFLDRTDLPGAPGAQTVKDHAQGVFEVRGDGGDGLRTVSQAAGMGLVPDELGLTEPPGGSRGLPLEMMRRSVRALDRGRSGAGQEVK